MGAEQNLMCGMRVSHAHRQGTIIELTPETFTIQFDDGFKRDFETKWSRNNVSILPTGEETTVLGLISYSLFDEPGISINPPKPDEKDLQLARIWSRGSDDLHRMLSARMAERAIAQHYRNKNRSVEDVAVRQLHRKSDDRDWMHYDLLIDEKPIDVKNATRAPSNKNRYVSHCVPRFKADRKNDSVIIAAAVSHWSNLETLKYQPNAVCFIGTTDYEFVKKLMGELSASPIQISLRDGLLSPHFLPPWLFSFDSTYYAKRDDGLRKLNRLAQINPESFKKEGIKLTPLYLMGVNSLEALCEKELSEFQRGIVKSLRARINRLGASLAVVFLTILEEFIQCIIRNRPFHTDQLFEVLFVGRSQTRPLFLHDPLETISGLIETLKTATNTGNDNLAQFKYFELQELNILRGKKRRNEKWKTVLAYCGGWIGTSRPCGNIPLVVGQHESCDCGRLVCDQCGFCSRGCHRMLQRRGYEGY